MRSRFVSNPQSVWFRKIEEALVFYVHRDLRDATIGRVRHLIVPDSHAPHILRYTETRDRKVDLALYDERSIQKINLPVAGTLCGGGCGKLSRPVSTQVVPERSANVPQLGDGQAADLKKQAQAGRSAETSQAVNAVPAEFTEAEVEQPTTNAVRRMTEGILSKAKAQAKACDHPTENHMEDENVPIPNKLRESPDERTLESRNIRIFLHTTSPGIDLSTDRLYHEMVLKLKKIAREMNWSIDIMEFGSGLTKDETLGDKSLECILDATRQCAYFVGILGRRSILRVEKTESWSPDTITQHPWTQSYTGKTLFEITIRGAASEQGSNAMRAFLYVEPGDDLELHPFVSLQDENSQGTQVDEVIKDLGVDFPITDCHNKADLLDNVMRQLKNAMKQDFFSTKKDTIREFSDQERFKSDKLKWFYGRKMEINTIIQKIKLNMNGDHTPFAICGPAGIGKTSIMAKVEEDVGKSASFLIASHFIGSTSTSVFVQEGINNLYLQLCQKLGISKQSLGSLKHRQVSQEKGFHSIVELANNSENRKINFLILIDGLDQLIPNNFHERPYNLHWIPSKLPKNLHVVLSTIGGESVDISLANEPTQSFEPIHAISSKGWPSLSIDRLSRQDTSDIVRKRMQHFPITILDQITDTIGSNTSAHHPLYLHLLLNGLSHHGNLQTLSDKLDQLLLHPTVKNLYEQVKCDLSFTYGPVSVDSVMRLVSASRFGVCERDIKAWIHAKLKPSSSIWESLFANLSLDFFTFSNERYTVSHPAMKSIICQDYEAQSLKKQYADFLHKICVGQSDVGPDVVADLCYSLFEAKDCSRLEILLKKDHVVDAMLGGNYEHLFRECWRLLSSNKCDVKKAYEEQFKTVSPLTEKLIQYFLSIHERDFVINILQRRLEIVERIEDRKLLGILYGQNGRHEIALQQYEKVITLMKSLPEDHLDYAVIYNNFATTFECLKRFDDAIRYQNMSITLRIQLFGDDHPSVAISYNNLANIYRNKSEYNVALEYHQKSLQIRLKTLGEDHASVATSYNNIATTYEDMEKYVLALESLEKSLSIKIKIYGEDSLGVVPCFQNMASVYHKQGKHDLALEFYRKSVEIVSKTLGNEHYNLFELYFDMGIVYESLGSYPFALGSYEKSLQVKAKAMGNEHKDLIIIYDKMAAMNEFLGKYAESLEMYKKSLKIKTKAFGADDIEIANTYMDIAIMYRNQHRYSDSLENYEKSLKMRISKVGEEHLDVAAAYNNIASIQKILKRYSESLTNYEKSLRIAIKFQGENHPEIASCYANIANLYDLQERFIQSLEYYNKALAIMTASREPHVDEIPCYVSVANIYRQQKRFSESIDCYKKSISSIQLNSGPYDIRIADLHLTIAQVYRQLHDVKSVVDHLTQAMNLLERTYGPNHKRCADVKRQIERISKEGLDCNLM